MDDKKHPSGKMWSGKHMARSMKKLTKPHKTLPSLGSVGDRIKKNPFGLFGDLRSTFPKELRDKIKALMEQYKTKGKHRGD